MCHAVGEEKGNLTYGCAEFLETKTLGLDVRRQAKCDTCLALPIWLACLHKDKDKDETAWTTRSGVAFHGTFPLSLSLLLVNKTRESMR